MTYAAIIPGTNRKLCSSGASIILLYMRGAIQQQYVDSRPTRHATLRKSSHCHTYIYHCCFTFVFIPFRMIHTPSHNGSTICCLHRIPFISCVYEVYDTHVITNAVCSYTYRRTDSSSTAVVYEVRSREQVTHTWSRWADFSPRLKACSPTPSVPSLCIPVLDR